MYKRQHGGWGIRYGKGERVYTIKGNKGIRIRFIDGKKIMLGTQKSDEFIRVMKFYEGVQACFLVSSVHCIYD